MDLQDQSSNRMRIFSSWSLLQSDWGGRLRFPAETGGWAQVWLSCGSKSSPKFAAKVALGDEGYQESSGGCAFAEVIHAESADTGGVLHVSPLTDEDVYEDGRSGLLRDRVD